MFSFDINEIQRELTCVIIALRDLADVRTYDLWILGVGIATFIASTAMAFFSYRLNKKQSDILEQQTGILKQQNKIALLKERCEVYSRVIEISFFIKSILQIKIYPSPWLGNIDLDTKLNNFVHSDLKDCVEQYTTSQLASSTELKIHDTVKKYETKIQILFSKKIFNEFRLLSDDFCSFLQKNHHSTQCDADRCISLMKKTDDFIENIHPKMQSYIDLTDSK